MEIPKESPIFKEGIRNVTFKSEGYEDCQGYYAKGNADIGLVIVSEWWGLNKNICATTDKFSTFGFHSLATDIYRGKSAIDRENAGHLMKGLDFHRAATDIASSVIFLKEKGCKHVAVTGFCMGGALVLATASKFPDIIELALPFYGIPDQSYFPAEKIKCPVYMFTGGLDDHKGFSDPESCLNLKEKCLKAGIKFELTIYENGKHAFMNPDSPNYDKVLADKATDTMLKIIKDNFKQ